MKRVVETVVSESAVAGNERIVEVLHALVTRADGTGVRELALALGASRSTVNRVLLGLEEHGLAAVSGNGNYQRERVSASAHGNAGRSGRQCAPGRSGQFRQARQTPSLTDTV